MTSDDWKRGSKAMYDLGYPVIMVTQYKDLVHLKAYKTTGETITEKVTDGNPITALSNIVRRIRSENIQT